MTQKVGQYKRFLCCPFLSRRIVLYDISSSKCLGFYFVLESILLLHSNKNQDVFVVIIFQVFESKNALTPYNIMEKTRTICAITYRQGIPSLFFLAHNRKSHNQCTKGHNAIISLWTLFNNLVFYQQIFSLSTKDSGIIVALKNLFYHYIYILYNLNIRMVIYK